MLAVAFAAGWWPTAAPAAVWTGTVGDGADRPGEADVAAVAVTYDEAGTIALRVRFHEPVAADDPTTIEWVVRPAADGAACADTRAGVAGLVEPRDGETTLTYTEVGRDGIPVEVEMPARQRLSADRRELTVTASSASLTDRTLRCSAVEVSNRDAVAPVLLRSARGQPDIPPPPGEGEGTGSEGAASVGDLRVSRVRLAFERRGRRVTGTLRALVCARPGLRIVAEVRERRRRHGTRRFGREHVHTYTRRQRAGCQFHRWSWRLRADPAARIRVAAKLRVRAVAPVSG